MRVVVALGGNALLKRGEPMTAEVQRANVRRAASALAGLTRRHDIVVAHGNGPQVGLLALQASAYKDVAPYPLDILGAESVGMIGYLVEQELANALAPGTKLATLLTQIEVDPNDPAFARPEKPIGPVYDDTEAAKVRRSHGWPLVEETDGRWRRVVPSPLPKRITQIETIRLLVDCGVTVICAGGGGIPVIRDRAGDLVGVEAVIDKDRAAGLLAEQLGADAFLMLTDVEAVYEDWGTPGQRPIRHVRPDRIDAAAFPAGSMGPKVEAACLFAARPGRMAGIGRLEDAAAILEGRAGTLIS
ncbi:carbamate kinase [Aquamicrobium defluvii]|uniref:Carbamate kinase n=1 Tax=Aquamicrobium defluvii TaxID=69279 RepID=A0A011U6K6_9HYPH|nr:carbamate kinase [Aquamicrobium defluvii]EXL01468.1 carbamate kinase [Aquamicrobium defluvii]EZQ13584.1 carbamate kinase [Halopseudomonas bauzanensis]TDR30951.1 carbamate kinase [Aquamicrobium defluvii]